MRAAFKTNYRVIPYSSFTLERTSIPAYTTAPDEFAIVIIEVPGPIFPGEIWEMAGYVVPENNLSSDKNVYVRTEIWAATQGGDTQDGDKPELCTQTGTFNLTPQKKTECIFREGILPWNTGNTAGRYAKIFAATAGGNIQSGDTIGIDSGLLMVKRIIPVFNK